MENKNRYIKLNLGCGASCPAGWVNIDSSFGVWLSKKTILKTILKIIIPNSWGILPNDAWPKNTVWMNLTEKFKFQDNSVDFIFSSHTFEHLTYEEASFVFKECYRVLKPKGVIRIIVPDFRVLVNQYLEDVDKNPSTAAKIFLRDSLYFEIPIPKTFLGLFKFYFQKKNNHHFLYDKSGVTPP